MDATFLKFDGETSDGRVRVRYGIPQTGFVSERYVDQDTARLLKIAKTAGRNEHIDEINAALKKG